MFLLGIYHYDLFAPKGVKTNLFIQVFFTFSMFLLGIYHHDLLFAAKGVKTNLFIIVFFIFSMILLGIYLHDLFAPKGVNCILFTKSKVRAGLPSPTNNCTPTAYTLI